MKARCLAEITGFALVALTLPLNAHHAFSAEYTDNRTVNVTGKLVKLDWKFPHAYAQIDVANPDGSVTAWTIEVGEPNVFHTQGWTTKGALGLIGQTSTTRGYPAKDGSNKMRALSLTTEKGAILSSTVKIENGEMFLDGVKLRAENGVIVAVPK